MNRSEAKILAPIIKAFGDKESVQFFNEHDKWIDISLIALVSFDHDVSRYRIKPEPEVIYVNKYEEDGDVEVFFSQEAAKRQDGRYEYIAKKFTAEE